VTAGNPEVTTNMLYRNMETGHSPGPTPRCQGIPLAELGRLRQRRLSGSISGEQLRKLALSQRGERHFRTSFLPDAVLSLHHACIHTLGSTRAFKIIENQLGIAFIQIVQNVLMPTAG
jgi:hypothetical protein